MNNSKGLMELIASFFTDRDSSEEGKSVNISFGRNFVYQNNVIQRGKNTYNEKITPDTAFVRRISVDTSCFDINITTADVSGVEVTLSGNTKTPDKIEFTTYVVESELVVKAKIKNGFFNGNLSLDLVLPREQRFKEMNVVTSTGDIEVSEKVLVNALKINTSSGEVDVTDFHGFESLEIKTTTGDINVNDDVEGGTLQIDTSSGEVEIYDGISAGDIKITTSTGEVDFSGSVTAENIKISTASGGVELDETVSKGYIDIKTSIGDIDIENTSAKTFGIKTSSGEVDLNAEFSNADVSTSVGGVDISTCAKTNIGITVVTGVGDVSIELDNVGKLIQTLKTNRGDVDCSYSSRGEYTAEINVTSSTGDIEIS